MSEFAYIDWIRRQIAAHPEVLIGPGDDAAALQLHRADALLVTVDMLMDGRHFQLAQTDPWLIGRKAMAVNLSDIAAMAGRPLAAVVAVALPRPASGQLREQLFRGMHQLAETFQTSLVGGDTNSWDGPLVLSVTLLGQATQRGPVRRCGAQIGDWLLVTGPLGGSILGKHLDFTPRVHEARRLHELAKIHAMIDLSDGLAGDLKHITDESGVGAVVFADAIPITPAAVQLGRQDGRPPLEHALGDGEDFELLLAVPPSVGQQLLHEQPISQVQLVKIGECIDHGLWLEQNGQRTALVAKGFEHVFEL